VAWGKQAGLIAQYLKRGSLLLVEGRLQTRDWQDDTGVKHWRTEIVVERLELGPEMGKKAESAAEMAIAAAEEASVAV
jgi:single-strand DNA-binding protein